MTLEELQSEIAKDSNFDKNDYEIFGSATLDTGRLVSKYMTLLSRERIKALDLDQSRKKILFWLNGYYKDNLYCDELKRKPSPKIARTNDERDNMVAIDHTLVALNKRIAESDEFIATAVEFVNYLRYNRTKEIRNFIDWKKWSDGQL